MLKYNFFDYVENVKLIQINDSLIIDSKAQQISMLPDLITVHNPVLAISIVNETRILLYGNTK